jgi:hypothetical protein
MITVPKTINLQRDRLGRRRLIATASLTAKIHTILDPLRAHQFQTAESKLRCKLSPPPESLPLIDPARHTFPITRACDPAVSRLELC